MLKNQKIWLGLITYNELKNITEMTESLDWCDGIVAVDHGSTDGTFELLESKKKEGKILRLPWMNLHYVSMTAVLQCGVIRPGDWVYFLDSQERVTEEYAKEIRSAITDYQAQGIGCVHWGRPLLFQKSVGMVYRENPHCHPYPLVGNVLDVRDESTVSWKGEELHLGKYLISKKNLDDTTILHGSKYYFYELSNQTLMFYGGFRKEIGIHHEMMRQQFLIYCQEKLGLKPGMDAFVEYLKENQSNLDPQIVDYMELEFPMKDLFRFKILGQSRHEILKNRYNWSLKHFLNTGDVAQEATGYVGQMNIYRAEQGQPHA